VSKADEFQERFDAFAVAVVQYCERLPSSPAARRVAGQLADAATAVPANYRGARRARSRAEFVSKLAIAVEESDEAVYWLQLVIRSGLAAAASAEALIKEGMEIRAVLSASYQTARNRRRQE
jgi:four helix bundle protein